MDSNVNQFHFLASARSTKHIPHNAIGGASFSQHACITSENLNGHPAIVFASRDGGAICKLTPYHSGETDLTNLQSVLNILDKALESKPDIFRDCQIWVCLPETEKNSPVVKYNKRILQLVNKLCYCGRKKGWTPSEYSILYYEPDTKKHNDGMSYARDAVFILANKGVLFEVKFNFKIVRADKQNVAEILAGAEPSMDPESDEGGSPKQLWTRQRKVSDKEQREMDRFFTPSHSTMLVNNIPMSKIHVSKEKEAYLQQLSTNAGLPMLFPATHHGKSHGEKLETPATITPPSEAPQGTLKQRPSTKKNEWIHYVPRETDIANKTGNLLKKASASMLERSAITPEPSQAHHPRGRLHHGQHSVKDPDKTPTPPRRTRSSSPAGIRGHPDLEPNYTSQDRERHRDELRRLKSRHSTPKHHLEPELRGSSPAQVHEGSHPKPSSDQQTQQSSKAPSPNSHKKWLEVVLRDNPVEHTSSTRV